MLEQEKPGRGCAGDPFRRACLSDRLGARRTRAALSRARRAVGPNAKPADRFDQRRRLRHRRLKACTERGVLVVNQSGGNAEAVAEHVVGMMLALVKRFNETDRALRAGTI